MSNGVTGRRSAVTRPARRTSRVPGMTRQRADGATAHGRCGRARTRRSSPTAVAARARARRRAAARPIGPRSSTRRAGGRLLRHARGAHRPRGGRARGAGLRARRRARAVRAERRSPGRAWRSARCAPAARSPASHPGATEDEVARPARDHPRARPRLRSGPRRGRRARRRPRGGAPTRGPRRRRADGGARRGEPAIRSSFDLLRADGPAPELPPGPERLALLPCSSGTTGLPKAVDAHARQPRRGRRAGAGRAALRTARTSCSPWRRSRT